MRSAKKFFYHFGDGD